MKPKKHKLVNPLPQVLTLFPYIRVLMLYKILVCYSLVFVGAEIKLPYKADYGMDQIILTTYHLLQWSVSSQTEAADAGALW